MQTKPHAPSCDRNRDAILAVLTEYFADRHRVLEIGSGTGQHAVYFAAALPRLQWQPSDFESQHDGIRAWIAESGLDNVRPPIALAAGAAPWPAQPVYDAVFSANTLHIMSWDEVQQLFASLDTVLGGDAKAVIYGPFNYNGRFTSASNAAFEQWLKSVAPHRGIRDFEAVQALAAGIGLRLLEDREMPANNRCLIWQRG